MIFSFKSLGQLEEIEAACWKALLAAVSDRESGWRLPVLATGNASVSQRTVVLRSVDVGHYELRIHTDVRSPKVDAVRVNGDVSMLFYDQSGVQLAVVGRASLHTDDAVADAMWQAEAPVSLKGYLGTNPPGAVMPQVDHNLPAELLNVVPERGEIEAGRANFAAIVIRVVSIDWLCLDRSGNRRARFVYSDGDCVQRDWIAP